MNLPPRYTRERKTAGLGGQGEVSIWRDQHLGRLVAIKRCLTQKDQAALRNELAALSRIRSKNVVEIYDLQQDPTDPGAEYLIMEFVDGDNLHHDPKRNRETYLKDLYQLACGLADIHACDAIHRDIKPSNIRRSASGIIKIIDFGITALSTPVNTLTGRGTWGFRGPEYYIKPRIVRQSADIYALGATAYFLGYGKLDASMEGHPPSQAPSFASLTLAGESLHSELIRLLDSCLSLRPEQRPSSVAVASTIHRHLVHNLHQGKLIYQGIEYLVNAKTPLIHIRGCFKISYNGLLFALEDCRVPVLVNNSPANNGDSLPGGCVLTFIPIGQSFPTFIQFNVSRPEVIL